MFQYMFAWQINKIHIVIIDLGKPTFIIKFNLFLIKSRTNEWLFPNSFMVRFGNKHNCEQHTNFLERKGYSYPEYHCQDHTCRCLGMS